MKSIHEATGADGGLRSRTAGLEDRGAACYTTPACWWTTLNIGRPKKFSKFPRMGPQPPARPRPRRRSLGPLPLVLVSSVGRWGLFWRCCREAGPALRAVGLPAAARRGLLV